jgi:hypothetical protein
MGQRSQRLERGNPKPVWLYQPAPAIAGAS